MSRSSFVVSGDSRAAPRKLTATALLMLILAITLSRIPFLFNTLIGEEGIFAYSVIGPQPSSEGGPWLLIAELDSKPIFDSPAHNAIPYWIIETLGRLVAPRVDFDHTSFIWKNVAARVPFLAFFSVGIVGLFWTAARSAQKGVVALAIAVMITLFGLTTPLAVGASIQPQIDGSVGVMLTGSAAFLLILACGSRSRWLALALSFVAGVLGGIGKHEWAMAFAGASVITVGALIIFARLSNSKEERYRLFFNLWVLGFFCFGLITGILFSLLVCFDCYVAGLNVMTDIYRVWSGDHAAVMNQISLFLPVIILGGAGVVIFLANPRQVLIDRPDAPLVLMAAGAILGGFFLSGWIGDGFPRYYAPALILSTYAILSMLGALGSLKLWPVAFVTALIVLSAGVFLNSMALYQIKITRASITSSYGDSLQNYQQHYAQSAEKSQNEHKIVFEGPAIVIYYPGIEFVANSFAPSDALDIVRAYAKDRIEDLALP